MDNDQDRLKAGIQIGDYLLTELLYDGESTRTWKAQQVSISREVIIDSLNREQQADEAVVSTFLIDVRAKASVDHPLIGSVLEAIREDKLCFYAREQLTGSTLIKLVETGAKLRPEKIVHIVRQLAEANLYLEEHGVASLPLQADQIYISEHSLTRIINMAVGGERDHQVSTTDKHSIATALTSLLETECPGSTRTRSLLDYMSDLEREIPLTWEQIRELAEGVELQLAEPSQPVPLENSTVRLNKRDNSKRMMMLAGVGIGAAAVIAVGSLLMNQPEKPKQRELPSMVQIPAGKYPTHDGTSAELSAFWVDSHEVTIAEYAEFLDALELLSRQQISIYQHEDQPESKTDHLPDDWDALSAAAKMGGSWNGLQLDPNCPVIGVDWWDAYAYSQFLRHRLPTQEEWHAALHYSVGAEQKLTSSPWGAVDHDASDVTGNGIHGLAGNVAEWSAKMSKDPAYPTKPKMPLVIGGSYLKKRSNATSREWLSSEEQDGRSLRRADLGFRTISSKAPTE